MIVVTRHKALLELLRERGLIDDTAFVVEHATADDVRGRHVIGILPLHLAAIASTVTTIPMDVPRELRGQELTLDQTREFAGEAVTYVVRERQELEGAIAWEIHDHLTSPRHGAADMPPMQTHRAYEQLAQYALGTRGGPAGEPWIAFTRHHLARLVVMAREHANACDILDRALDEYVRSTEPSSTLTSEHNPYVNDLEARGSQGRPMVVTLTRRQAARVLVLESTPRAYPTRLDHGSLDEVVDAARHEKEEAIEVKVDLLLDRKPTE